MSAPQRSTPPGSTPPGSAPQRSAPQASTPPLTPAAGWFEELRRDNDSVWGAIHSHPFVTGIGSGTLDVDRFRFFLSQDYPYLKEFCRVLALAVSRGGRLDEMAFFASLLHATLAVEMDLHRSYCADFGISPEDLAATSLAPTAHAYTRHLLAIGALGTQAEIAVALAPCIVSYAEIGRNLARAIPPGAPLLARWIEAYASDPYQSIAREAIALVDRLAERIGPEERERCAGHFRIGSLYEWRFWEMAWTGESWPIPGAERAR